MNNNEDIGRAVCVLLLVIILGIIFKACDTIDERREARRNTKPAETVRIEVRPGHYIDFEKVR